MLSKRSQSQKAIHISYNSIYTKCPEYENLDKEYISVCLGFVGREGGVEGKGEWLITGTALIGGMKIF